MCRWGCTTTDTTYMCKWCGIRYCRECLRGDFEGYMRESTICRKCFQPRCQGVRVEFVAGRPSSDKDKKGARGKSARSRSASSRGRSASAKRGKSAGRKKSGKKSAKKRKR